MMTLRCTRLQAAGLAMLAAMVITASSARADWYTCNHACDQTRTNSEFNCDDTLTGCHLSGGSFEYCDYNWRTCYDSATSAWNSCVQTCGPYIPPPPPWNPPPPDPWWGPNPLNPDGPMGPRELQQGCGPYIDCGPW